MADVDEKGERRLGQVQSRGLEGQPEAQGARNAGASDIRAIQALNRNAHNGSAGGDQNESVEIVMPKDSGGYDVLASRLKAQEKQEEPVQKANFETQLQSKQTAEPLTVDFLRAKAQQGDIWARSFMPELEQAQRLPVGATQDLLMAQVLKKAEVIFRPEDRVKAQPEQVSEDQSQTSTGAIIAKQAEKNPAVEPVKALYNWAEKLEPGPEKEKHQQLAREQLVQVEPQAKRDLERLDQRRQLMAEQEDCGVHEVTRRLKEPMQGQVSYPDKEIEGVRRLTPEDLKKLAKAMEVAGPAAEESIKQTTQEILVRTGESSRDTMLAGINLVVGLLKYDRDLLLNPEQAKKDASKAGEALGLLLVAGVEIGVGIAGTAEEAKQSGDYSLPLSRTAEALNRWYERQTPADQMAIMSEICAGFGLTAFGKEATRLKEKGAFMAFLKEGLEVLPRNPEAEIKALEALAGVLKGRQPLREAVGIGTVEKAGEVVKEAQEKGIADHIMAMVQFLPERGKEILTDRKLRQEYGLTKKELLTKTEAELAALRIERIEASYRTVFYRAYPHLKGTGIAIHHALPQSIRDRYPGLFKAKEVHSLKYLSGIPKTAEKDGESVHDLITQSWEQFKKKNATATRQQVIEHMRKLDEEYGRYFVPPFREGER